MTQPNGLLAAGGDLTPATLISAMPREFFHGLMMTRRSCGGRPAPDSSCAPVTFVLADQCASTFVNLTAISGMTVPFSEVIHHCATAARGGDVAGTWITEDMQAAYQKLHEIGIAHSIEVYEGNQLIGGLYGIPTGAHVFWRVDVLVCSNASKVAFIALNRPAREPASI